MATRPVRTTDQTNMLQSFPSTGDSDCDFLFKIVLIGDASVGKTCLLQRFRYGTYSERHSSTIGVDFTLKTIKVDGKTIKLHLWDTAGQERFRTITQSYYRNAQGILLAYDITKERTFTNLVKWTNDVVKYCGTEVLILIIGNKADLVRSNPQRREVEEDSCRRFAQSKVNIVGCLETSSKENTNIDEAFYQLASALKQKYERNRSSLCESTIQTDGLNCGTVPLCDANKNKCSC